MKEMNSQGHNWQTYGFSPVCIRSWFFTLSWRLKLLLQYLHEKGFSPVWLRICLVKSLGCWAVNLQREQGWILRSPFTNFTAIFVWLSAVLIEVVCTFVTCFSVFFGVFGCCIDRSGLAMASSSSLKTNVKWSRSSLARGWLFWLLNWFANSEMTAASSVAKLKSLLSSFFLDCSLQSFLWLKNSAMSANVVRHLPQRCKSSSWSSSEVESSSSVNVIPDMIFK